MVGLYHGTLLRAWQHALTSNMNDMIGTAKALLKKYSAALMPENAGNQVGRVVSRFALVAGAA
jgi:putative DNA primase/helicase